MLKLRKLIVEAVSMVITENDLEKAFVSALENWDFSEQLEAYAEKKLDDFSYWDEVIDEVAEDMLD